MKNNIIIGKIEIDLTHIKNRKDLVKALDFQLKTLKADILTNYDRGLIEYE
jgi:hypothetical protein